MLGPSAAWDLSAEPEHTPRSRCALWLGDGESGHHHAAASPVPRDGGPFPGHSHQQPSQVRRAAFGDALQGHTLFHGINTYFFPWCSATPRWLLPFPLSSFPASLSLLSGSFPDPFLQLSLSSTSAPAKHRLQGNVLPSCHRREMGWDPLKAQPAQRGAGLPGQLRSARGCKLVPCNETQP